MIAEGIAGSAETDEIAGHGLGPLVQQLVKRMLAVRSRLAPDHGSGAQLHRPAIAAHAFAVRFHLQLLEKGREAAQVLGIGQDGAGCGNREN